ncbi:hypothetical protein B0H21DRAFT_334771 [Amylocystis lapponica]|nr:hypothetical protein B0H21DRAFT_334771 [Amylocystis lapponica]
MPAWDTKDELMVDAEVFIKFMHALCGWYFWEFAISLDFEWALITRQKKFHWPLIFYFAGRYALLFTFVGIIIALDSTKEVNCSALYAYNQFMGSASVGFASINLSIRTMAVWHQNLYITIPLVIIILGHWSIILQGVLLEAVWVPGSGCAITKTNNSLLAATFIYSMAFDAVVTILNIVKLLPRAGSSQLVRLLFHDGLIYFVIAFVVNLCATIFMALNLNSVMNVIFNVPAAVVSTIMASRLVRRLSNFQNAGPEVYSNSTHSAIRGTQGPMATQQHKTVNGGVHVQMQTFAVTDDHLSDTTDVETKQRIPDIEAGDPIDPDMKTPRI